MNLRSRFQFRYQLDVPPEGADGTRNYLQTLNIATARVWLSGYVFQPELTYMIQLAVAGRDYRDGATSPLFDAYIDWKAHRDFNLRGGQFFVPFDRLRTVREFALQMVDRPGPVQELTLDRDAGVVAYSERIGGSPLGYRVGVFGGGGTNVTAGKEPGFLVMGRLELRPLGPIDDDVEGDLERRETPGLAIGAGIAHNSNTNRARSTTGATFTGGTADYLHLAGDLVFKWRGLAAQFEYLFRDAWRDSIVSEADGETVTEYTRSGKGWVAQASYLFETPFEVVGRLSRNYATGGTDPRFVSDVESRGQEVGLGLNYYLNGHQFKVQGGWIGKMPSDFKFDEGTHSAVLQLDATF